ncbi:CDP-glycerol glycerophosphotransferase family protein [Candidatus Parcubacteria bacterium]|nr:CDP-glycerol glycerophosphotransferase family protein [Candidatus Parcubacteria bacterium]
MKTIFIVISRGTLVRNILRNKCFDILKNNSNLRIVLLFNNIFNTEPPKYLEEEFGGPNIFLEFVPNKFKNRYERLFNSFTRFLVYTKSSIMVMQNKIEAIRKTNKITVYLMRGMFFVLSKINFLKTLARWITVRFFQDDSLSIYFEKYKPDLVFSTFILSNLDVGILKQAKKRGIKTVSMPKSWDNLDKLLFIVDPDIFLVQNKEMKEETKKYQHSKGEIKVVGFPQFDRYAMGNFLSKDEYCERKGFDSALPILFLGSEGKWSAGDELIFRDIIALRDNGLIPQCNILMRPHFSDAKPPKYAEFESVKNVYVDNKFRHSDFFTDNWDPTKEDYEDFVNSLYHCNIMLTFASTLAIDASCFDKPVILIDYGVKYGESEKTAAKMYDTGHFEQITSEKATFSAPTKEDVARGINMYLKNNEIQREERQRLRRKMCGELDGKAGERIAKIILEFINK